MAHSRRIVAATFLALAVTAPNVAVAWKPYTHNYTGDQVLSAVDFASGTVEINGQHYAIPWEVVTAIRNQRAYYYAGTVGPDGFPDLAYGQAVIHPTHTGKWLQYLLAAAWNAQSSGAYSLEERQQILAFTYGFLTHAAGDVWGHTLVNELSRGVFPGFQEILDAPGGGQREELIAYAVRHIIVEGMVGDATPGYDGNPARKVAPADYGLTGGDISDSATPGYPYLAPHKFLQNVLVSEFAPTPIPISAGFRNARGPVLGYMFELRENLRAYVTGPADPIAVAVDVYHEYINSLKAHADDCNFDGVEDFFHDLVACPWALVSNTAQAFWDFVWGEAAVAVKPVINAYVVRWIDDIDTGVAHWSEFGLATTQGLFDAQTRRAVQNHECWSRSASADQVTDGPEATLACISNPSSFSCQNRANCESGISIIGAGLTQADGFINSYGLSMVGFPDVVGDLRSVFEEVSDAINEIMAALHVPPVFFWVGDQVSDWIKEKVTDLASEALGMDLERLADLLKRPTSYICEPNVSMKVPALGDVVIPLFTHGENGRLDDYLGFTMASHEPDPSLPPGCGRYRDDVGFDPHTFGPIRNTITTGKLLLLSGGELNRALAHLSGHPVVTYTLASLGTDPLNVMFTQNLHGPAFEPWLELIDGDHAWRGDGLPVFGPRTTEKTGGTGYFPLWSSCVLRPAFRALFQDWENPWSGSTLTTAPGDGRGPGPGVIRVNFPSLGDGVLNDAPLPDGDNDPAPPRSTLTWAGNTFAGPAGNFVGPNHGFKLEAHDEPAGKAFPDDQLKLRRRWYAAAVTPPAFSESFQGDTFTIAGPDAAYRIDHQSADPCHTWADDPLPVDHPEVVRTFDVTLDATPPVTTCNNPPFGRSWPTDAVVPVSFAVADGAIGSGVASVAATVDGLLGATAPVTIANGDPLDMFQFLPGTRTVLVHAIDNVQNASSTPCHFELHATIESLIANLIRVRALGLVPDPAVFKGLMDKLQAAKAAHDRGSTGAELNILAGFVNQLLAQRGHGIDLLRANQLILFAQDLIVRGG